MDHPISSEIFLFVILSQMLARAATTTKAKTFRLFLDQCTCRFFEAWAA
jgi:hypothetical protein